ncbi:hypothetical protein XBFFL1_1040010 [Xenorhabdus bovienii str. feltiae Florida]|uniref:Uncharacterized protein n=1 Tax=Xenorhabdus bovienii str. kraussei Becker Underwood TaxID=1398204 RepID=A0A077PUH1_XENBV|nr:hypothetical protein XBFFR1_1800002 [Xenorhabdus bovienii str. feltiae France]CDG90678.1 hypothetical protein XBFFL1_1040010 [Xenorhabdus bovienii str. feltiae Florida]CDH24327.1 hypothetical protein XBKB1_2630002 [Xenorhabdus bovienii str. kraussei Becker Underwood]
MTAEQVLHGHQGCQPPKPRPTGLRTVVISIANHKQIAGFTLVARFGTGDKQRSRALLCSQASEQLNALRESITLKFQKAVNNFFHCESSVSLWDAVKITPHIP